MNHGQIHCRGENCEPDIELHLYVYSISGQPPYTRVLVRDKRDWDAAPVELMEKDIDYRDELKAGCRNVFYVPLSMAKERGLCEKCDKVVELVRPID